MTVQNREYEYQREEKATELFLTAVVSSCVSFSLEYIVELVEVWRPSSFMQLSKEDGVYKRTLQ